MGSFVRLDGEEWIRAASRALIIGGPNTFKTTSICYTWPKPIGLISYPGEKGTGSIPKSDDIIAFGYKEDFDIDKPDTWQDDLDDVIAKVEGLTWELLSGKYGQIKTFAGDGLTKLAACYWRREFKRQMIINDLLKDPAPEDKVKLSAYGNENYGSTSQVLKYLSKVSHSAVENVVFTCWEGQEPDEQTSDTGQKGKTHTFAELPGRLARFVTGEFSVVLRATVSLPDPMGNRRGEWQTRPGGKVWGVGVKGPLGKIKQLPEKVPMDWMALKQALMNG